MLRRQDDLILITTLSRLSEMRYYHNSVPNLCLLSRSSSWWVAWRMRGLDTAVSIFIIINEGRDDSLESDEYSTILSNGQLIPIFVILETRSEFMWWRVDQVSSTTDTNLWFLVTHPSSDKLLDEQKVRLAFIHYQLVSSRLRSWMEISLSNEWTSKPCRQRHLRRQDKHHILSRRFLRSDARGIG